MKIDLFDISVEIEGISMILAGLANQLDNDLTDTLTPDSMANALFGVRMHLERIAKDLQRI